MLTFSSVSEAETFTVHAWGLEQAAKLTFKVDGTETKINGEGDVVMVVLSEKSVRFELK